MYVFWKLKRFFTYLLSDIIFDINESKYTPFIYAVTFENEKRLIISCVLSGIRKENNWTLKTQAVSYIHALAR